jgi:hypothetical protein
MNLTGPLLGPLCGPLLDALGQSRSVFSPLVLFAGGVDGAWYDPSDLTTLFQDSAGTTPVTASGQPVGMMRDKSGNGRHLTQATAAARPTYRTTGYPHLEFDGIDDCMVSAATFTIQLPVWNIHIVSKAADMAGNVFGMIKDASNYAAARNSATATNRMTGGLREGTIGTTTVNTLSGAVPLDTIKVVGTMSIVGTTDIVVNAGTPVTGANSWLAETTIASCAIGINTSTAGGAAVAAVARFYGGIALKANPGTANRAKTNSFLGRKVGLSI